MIYACLGTVSGGSGSTWQVDPLIIEDDGTNHPTIDVTVRDGITPTEGDTVLIEFMRNNLSLSPVKRYFEASESNGVIIGIIKTSDGYTLTGDYNFIGDVSIKGKLSQQGDVTILGNTTMTGNLTVTGTINAASIIVGGIDVGVTLAAYLIHKHGPGTFSNSGGAVAGLSGGPI